MNDILESKHHISAMLSWDDWVDLLGKSYLDDFIEKRYQHYLRIRLLAPKTKISVFRGRNDKSGNENMGLMIRHKRIRR